MKDLFYNYSFGRGNEPITAVNLARNCSRCQFHQHYTYEYFVRTSFFQLRFGFVEKFVRKTRAYNVDEIDYRPQMRAVQPQLQSSAYSLDTLHPGGFQQRCQFVLQILLRIRHLLVNIMMVWYFFPSFSKIMCLTQRLNFKCQQENFP